MIRRRLSRVGIIFAGLVTLAALWVWYQFPSTSLRYRLSVEVMTPEGPKTGSSVIEVTYASQCCIPGFGRRGDTSLVGEAVYVDLGGGKNLFVTLTDDGSGREGDADTKERAFDALWLPVAVYGLKWSWGEERKLGRRLQELRGTPARDVPPVMLPTVVTFRNIADPKSVELVDPRDLSKTFGQGYALTRATVEATDAPLTEGIESVLGWMPTLKSASTALDGTRYSGPRDPIASQLGYLSFKNWGL